MLKNLKKIENLLLLILAITIILFMIDENKLYRLSKDELPKYSKEKIAETVVYAKNIKFEKEKKLSDSYVYIYKVDNTYACLIYNKSLFYNKYSLESATYNITLDKTFTESFSNQLYDSIYSLNIKDNNIHINASRHFNYNIIKIIIFISASILICIIIIKKFSKPRDENNNESK
ncbi:hypothetical protein [Miniphocaeibacter massiliensis]|uniref:hypothetical protein n=1 Tax=Miniphocaeibacter massiliensis TaxID=2041841 RepID=UPI000C1BF8D6|nr:hypothetical protein [Miniphocaeibacter massiliensis]